MRSLGNYRSLMFLLVASIAVSCTPNLQPLTPEMQKQRGVYEGYSLLPPQGSEWAVAKVTRNQQVYVRRLADQPQYSTVRTPLLLSSLSRFPNN